MREKNKELLKLLEQKEREIQKLEKIKNDTIVGLEEMFIKEFENKAY